MVSEKIIIEMTPFIFENGETYYFQIKSIIGVNAYSNLFCYKKIKKQRYKFFPLGKYDHYSYEQIGSSEWIKSSLDGFEIEDKLKRIVQLNISPSIPNWDGFVGNVPEDVKKSLLRNSKLNNLFNENS